MKIHFPSNLYRYASITLAGTLTTGAIFFSHDLQTFASFQNSLTASPSDANRGDSIPSLPLATPSDAEHSSSEDRDEDNEIIATPSDATSSDAHKRPASPLTLFLLHQMRPQKIERRKTPPLTEPKYDRTEGSEDVTNLLVPTLAYDDTSVTLVWNKPENTIQLQTTLYIRTVSSSEQPGKISPNMPNGQAHIWMHSTNTMKKEHRNGKRRYPFLYGR